MVGCFGHPGALLAQAWFFRLDSMEHSLEEDSLVVKFNLQNTTKIIRLQRAEDLYSEHTKIHYSADKVHQTFDEGNLGAESVYEVFLENGEYILGMLIPGPGGNHIKLTLDTEDNEFEIGHHTTFRKEIGDESFKRRLEDSKDWDSIDSGHGYYITDTLVEDELGSCGDDVVEEDGQHIQEGRMRKLGEMARDQITSNVEKLSAKACRDLSGVVRPDQFAFYPGCYPNDHRLHVAEIGIATTKAFYEHHDRSFSKVRAYVENIVRYSSYIFQIQFNIKIKILHLRIAGDKIPKNWDKMFRYSNVDGTCPRSRTIYDRVYNWTKKLPKQARASHWHLMHRCANTNNGWARVRSFCKPGGSAISRSGSTRVFLHEIGHAMGGMRHSFENGKYETGGYMSYGSSYLPGTNKRRFNPVTRKKEACAHFSSAANNKKCSYFRMIKNVK